MEQKGMATENINEMVEMHQLPVTSLSSDSTSNHMEEQMQDDVIIDIKTMIQDSGNGLMSPTCCIYRAPHAIRDLKEDAYTPRVVSIGPYHYDNKKLQVMERHKQIFFKRFTQEAMISLEELVNFVEHSEPTVRASYSENIKLSKKELVKVILVDAGFIIELFRKMYRKSHLSDDSKLSQPWLVDIVLKDLLLLENQLPFFFLEDLFNKAFRLDLRGDAPTFLELTYDFFDYFNMQNLEINHNARIKHFTDLLRFFHLQGQKPQRSWFGEAGNHILSYSANELQEAGVKLKASTSKCLLELKFSKRILEVPKILVEDRTETLFRNMIALEQCHYPFSSYITDYALMLDCLININNDVDVLIHKGIIRNYLGDTNDVAKLFNGLCKNVVQEDFNCDYVDMCKRLNGFYQNPWHKKKAALRGDYCKTPWQTAASIAGILLLLLSLVQTIFSILQVALKKI